jgi:hypothetical protein
MQLWRIMYCACVITRLLIKISALHFIICLLYEVPSRLHRVLWVLKNQPDRSITRLLLGLVWLWLIRLRVEVHLLLLLGVVDADRLLHRVDW